MPQSYQGQGMIAIATTYEHDQYAPTHGAKWLQVSMNSTHELKLQFFPQEEEVY